MNTQKTKKLLFIFFGRQKKFDGCAAAGIRHRRSLERITEIRNGERNRNRTARNG
jgi:hypothetical protein